MDIEKIGNGSQRTPVRGRSSQGSQQNPQPVLIQIDSPELEQVQSTNKSDCLKDQKASPFIDQKTEHQIIMNQYQEKKNETNIFSQAERKNFGDFKTHLDNIKIYTVNKEKENQVSKSIIDRNNFGDFKAHLDGIKIYTVNQEKENQISQSIIESNKQLSNRNSGREMQLQDSVSQSKQNELSLFKDSQNEEFKIKLKQKELIITQKEDENRELFTKIKILEQRLSGQELELVELKQTNKKYNQLIDEQKSIFEKKIQKVQSNQDTTSEINSDWKKQLFEQKQLVEELQRKVIFLESKLERTEIENQSMAEKNMELSNENYDLKEDIEKQKRDYQLLKAQKRQEDGIFDEYGNQQNKFINSLISYQKDLKDIFDQINNNPIIEKYKKQNDELLIENASLRNQVIKLNQEISEQHLEEIQKKNKDIDVMNDPEDLTSKNNALMLYENMMQKFTEMDERMVQNDNEKFEALQQKDFWFGKSQQLENEVQLLKEQIKNINAKIEEMEGQYTKNNKKGNNQNLNNNKTKKRKAGKESEIDEDSTHITDKKVKPNLDSIDLSPQQSLQPSTSVNNYKNDINQEKEAPSVPVVQKSIQLTTTPSIPSKNTALFMLRVCIKCNLNIKKLQEFESCTVCRKDYHAKCKGESIIGAFCHNCYEKQKKKANQEMEVEKQNDNNKQQDMVAENTEN